MIIAQQVVKPTQNDLGVLLDCTALCVFEFSTSVDCVIDCSTPLHNTGITRGAPNIPQIPFMSAFVLLDFKMVENKEVGVGS